MVGNFLDVGIFGLVGFVGSLTLIQHFKREHTFYVRSCWFWNDPSRIELLDGFQTWHHRRLQAGRSKNDKIMGKGRIMRLIHSKV